MTTWLGLLGLFAGIMALFVLWDLTFCGGQRCRELGDRALEIHGWLFGRGPAGPRSPSARE